MLFLYFKINFKILIKYVYSNYNENYSIFNSFNLFI